MNPSGVCKGARLYETTAPSASSAKRIPSGNMALRVKILLFTSIMIRYLITQSALRLDLVVALVFPYLGFIPSELAVCWTWLWSVCGVRIQSVSDTYYYGSG